MSPTLISVRRIFLLAAFPFAGLSLLAAEPAVLEPKPAGVEAPPKLPKWEEDIRRFEEADAKAMPAAGCIVFVGSSSIRLWKTLAQDFPGLPVVNRGFGGSEIEDSVNFAERIVTKYKPRQVVMYAGGNDINKGKSAERVLADFQAFADKVRAALPDAKISYISIAPNPARWHQIETVRAANTAISELCRKKGYDYIDTHTGMLGADGLPRPEIFVADRLHMNEKGYVIWAKVVGPHLLKE